jgi:hypothetical protein
VPASFQKRSFPFRVNGVRADSLSHLDLNFGRSVQLGRRQLQFRINIINALRKEQLAAPILIPTSSLFGTISSATTQIGFVTFQTRLTF